MDDEKVDAEGTNEGAAADNSKVATEASTVGGAGVTAAAARDAAAASCHGSLTTGGSCGVSAVAAGDDVSAGPPVTNQVLLGSAVGGRTPVNGPGNTTPDHGALPPPVACLTTRAVLTKMAFTTANATLHHVTVTIAWVGASG